MYEVSEQYSDIAKEVLEANESFTEASRARVLYLESDAEKSKNKKTVYAECKKVEEIYKTEDIFPYDFIITVYTQNCRNFTDKQKHILIEHELMHIGIDNDGVEPSWYIVPHDVEEFQKIIDRYGDWINGDKV